MKKIAVIGLDHKEEINHFLDYLEKLKVKYQFRYDSIIYSKNNFSLYDSLNQIECPPAQYDAVISLGGDGTFLYTSRIFAGTDVPIFGVNLGRLGFNTTIEIKDFEPYFHNFMHNKAEFAYKKLLDIQIEGDPNIYSVLNESVISHTGISRMIHLKVDLDGHSVYEFSGDGLIVSSPTGSTAYNLSAGGPILHPSLEAYVLTPICPHSLAIRPYIIPFDEIIHIMIKESNANPQVTLDGQKIILLDIGQKITIKKSAKMVKVIESRLNFSEILKNKLGWNV